MVLLFSVLTVHSRSFRRYEGGKDRVERKGAWKYTLRFTSPGTRSEGSFGRLFWNKREIPSCFHEISCPLGGFAFYQGRYRWGGHGWMRKKKTGPGSLPMVRKICSRSAVKRGWYRDKFRRIRTPRNWVRVRRGGAYYWTAPGKLTALAARKKWSRLQACRNLFRFR